MEGDAWETLTEQSKSLKKNASNAKCGLAISVVTVLTKIFRQMFGKRALVEIICGKITFIETMAVILPKTRQ